MEVNADTGHIIYTGPIKKNHSTWVEANSL